MTYFVLHAHTQRCSCGLVQHWSHLYECKALGSTTQMLPAHFVPSTAPIARESITHSALLPFCHICLPADAELRGAEQRAEWEAIKRRKAAAASQLNGAGPKPVRPPAPIETLA